MAFIECTMECSRAVPTSTRASAAITNCVTVTKVDNDRANNDLWDGDADLEKAKEAEKLMSETDMCCFCDFDCPPPTQQENKKRNCGLLQSLCDHIELSHPLAWEWLG